MREVATMQASYSPNKDWPSALFVGGRVNIIGVGFPWLLFNLYDQKISSKLIVCLLFMVIIGYLRNFTVGFTAAFT